MQWWGWVLVAIVVLALAVGALLAVQAKRRKGGVIVGEPRVDDATGQQQRRPRPGMSRLMRTSEVASLPVVTLAGEDVAQIKDVVFSADGGAVAGFSLAGRGLLAGPLKQGVLWSRVVGLGPDAVMIADEDALDSLDDVVAAAASSTAGAGSGGNVLGDRVLTDSGVDLGKVSDVVIEYDNADGGGCDVVGYEIEASEALAASSSSSAKNTRLLLPLPDTMAVSAEHVMVPASAENFVSNDLAGFGAAVLAFRAQLKGSN